MIAFRKDIQGLRALAVISVVLFHLGIKQFKGGFVGVDVFFVISGYLITKQILTNLGNGTFTLADFYRKRIRRLFPALFATVALSFAGAFFLFTPKLFQQFGTSAIASVLSVSNILFWSEAGYFDTAGHLKPLLHMWSLSVEEQFYLVWPLTMILLWRVRAPILAAITIIGILSFASFLILPLSQNDGFFLMPFRIFQFASGAVVIWLERYPAPNKIMEGLLLLGLSLILYSILRMSSAHVFPGINTLPPTVGAMLAIYAGRASIMGRALNNKIAVWIGTISYSLYLVHWPLTVFFDYQLSAQVSKAARVGLKAVLVVFMVLSAALMYSKVEKKFRSKTPGVPLVRLAALAAGLASISLCLSLSDGWTWRLGNRRAIAADISEYGGEQCTPPRCSSGPQKKPVDYYVIGDSHARAYYAGFAALFPNKHIVFYEASGCPFYSLEYTAYYDKNPKSDQACRHARERAFEEIRKSPAPVILGQNWTTRALVSQRNGTFRAAISETDGFIDFIASELHKMRDGLAPQLYVIGDIPTTGTNKAPGDCIDRPFFATSCDSVPLSNIKLQRRAHLNQILSEKVSGFATFIDPYPAICDSDKCWSVKDGAPLYSDDNHLSKAGSIHVISSLAKQLPALTH